MAKNWKVIHIKSKQRGEDRNSPKLPTSEQLEYGEIAINYGDGIETIAIRNENDEIVKFVSEKKVQEIIDRKIGEMMKALNRLMSEPDDDNSIDSGEY